jgi:6-phosphogluconolactonase (cycloisomerase 2 family)
MLGTLAAFAPGAAQAAEDGPGAVYVMSNAPAGNAVLVFNRAANGALTAAGSYATGGTGTGGGLGSQGALVLSENHQWLLAVNAGSNSVSVFVVRPDGLRLVSTAPSGGILPTSLTMHNHQVFVLNAGGTGNITGFELGSNGQLLRLAGWTRGLSNGGVGAAPGPAQVAFNPDGRVLVVTEKSTNLIDTYTVDLNGQPSAAVTHPSSGVTPFGFGFDRQDTLIVSEAFGGAPNGSAVSSYRLHGDNLQVVSASVPTHQTSACWIVVTGNGKYTYTTDAASGAISGYAIADDGSLTLLNADGQTAFVGGSVADMALSQDSQYLTVFAGGIHQIVTFKVGSDGSLASLGGVSIPAGAAGIAAH